MTESQVVSRGGGSLGPIALPAVMWYEFVLNENLLEDHLQQEMPEPNPVQLLVTFMQQAKIEFRNVMLTREASPPSQQVDGKPGYGPQSEVKPEPGKNQPALTYENLEEAMRVIPPKHLKKVVALKTLALKVAAHLKWNMSILEKGISQSKRRSGALRITVVPLPVSKSLMLDLLKMTLGEKLEGMNDPDIASLSDTAAFAVHLYHRWCVQSVVKDSFPSRPVRQHVFTIADQIDPAEACAAATEAICTGLKGELSNSIQMLERFLQTNKTLSMPTPNCFNVPSERTEVEYDWNQGRVIPPEEVRCQVCYDLGCVLFHQEEYKRAYELFTQCQTIHDKLKEHIYISIDTARLRGYLISCSSLLGIVTDPHKLSIFQRAENSRKNNFEGLIDILLDDNVSQELSVLYRTSLEDDVLHAGKGCEVLYTKVCICNVVRGVMEGKALVSPVLFALEKADQSVTMFLVMTISRAMKGASFSQRANLKCFIQHLIELAEPESGFTNAVLGSELATYFDKEECMDMALGDEGEQMYLEDFDSEDPGGSSASFPASREPTYNLSDLEGKLLTLYDPGLLRDVVSDLHGNRNWRFPQFLQFNDKWKVPREIRQLIDGLNHHGMQKPFVYVLVSKARHCMEVKIFDRARQLFAVADSVVSDLSYVLSKHVRWQSLLADLRQYDLNQTFGEGCTLQDLVKKTKTCLTTIRLGQEIQPSEEVLEECTAFLVNIKDWDYLCNLENTANGYIELSRLLACCCKELPVIRTARKPARDLWDAVLQIFQTKTQHKRSSSGRESAMHRDSQQGMLPRDSFISFLLKITDQSVLTLFIASFTKLFTILKDDITSQIASEYQALWPTAIANAGGLSVESMEDALTTLMKHSLTVVPTQQSWLRTQADIYFAQNQYSAAMKLYLEVAVVSTDFFSRPVPKSVFDDQIYRRMMKCCSYLQCHTQVAVLCQFLDEVDYAAAFKALQEKTTYDAMDAYYTCIWDVSVLEYLTHLHGKRGELEKKQSALRALSQMDLNSSNPEEIQRRAIHVRKTRFLRSLAKQYLS
ncbi:integrator complex subunit 8-like isoform X2 [Haliotis rufescens]|uniref:integrator complex subunit 8-like isoform X2 n=1 Tax=Haliotis rufescens TaxID=6454 RepID=UPI001EAFB2AC|nr:integrator complex subunit 8-like isoform X2 [Haliotis rufescens]